MCVCVHVCVCVCVVSHDEQSSRERERDRDRAKKRFRKSSQVSRQFPPMQASPLHLRTLGLEWIVLLLGQKFLVLLESVILRLEIFSTAIALQSKTKQQREYA